jgi:predicted PurR-regulated permease PerM
MPTQPNQLFEAIRKGLLYAAGLLILLWLCFKIISVILLLLFALVLVVILNAPVTWLEKRGMRRVWACVIVFLCILIVVVGIGWMVVPKISTQFASLVNNLPGYANRFSKNVASWFTNYPTIQQKLSTEGSDLANWVPSLPNALLRIGNYTLSILGLVIVLIIFFSMVIYAVANPRPLLEVYFSLFSDQNREKAQRALMHSSEMLIGWVRANLIGGAIAAVLVTIFLTIIGVPGAWVWGSLALFAELIPKIGFFIMSIPPILVALSVSPLTALWVLIFYLALDEVLGDFVMPRLRSNTMKIHPVSGIFLLLAMGSAFGLLGALLSMPLAAIIKAYYEEFYLSNLKEDKEMEHRIDEVIYHDASKGQLAKNKAAELKDARNKA